MRKIALPVEEGRFVSLDIVFGKPHATIVIERKWWEFWKPKCYAKLFEVDQSLSPIMAEVVDFALAKRKQAEDAAVAEMHAGWARRKSQQSSS